MFVIPFASSLLSLARGLQVWVCVCFLFVGTLNYLGFMTFIKYSIFIVQKKIKYNISVKYFVKLLM